MFASVISATWARIVALSTELTQKIEQASINIPPSFFHLWRHVSIKPLFSGIFLCVWATVGLAQSSEDTPMTSENSTPPPTLPANSESDNEDVNSSSTSEKPDSVFHGPRAEILYNEEMQMMAVAESIQDAEVVWLEAAEQKFLSLYDADRSGNPQGAVILLHDSGHHANWPRSSSKLRRHLAYYGWSSLAINLPTAEHPKPPPRPKPIQPPSPPSDQKEKENGDSSTSKVDRLPETEVIYDSETGELSDGQLGANAMPDADTMTDENVDDGNNNIDEAMTATEAVSPENKSETTPKYSHDAIIDLRLKMALDFLHSKGQFNVAVIGFGEGAFYAARFAADMNRSSSAQSAPPKSMGENENTAEESNLAIGALVMIDPKHQAIGVPTPLLDYLTDPKLQVLDIITEDNELQTLLAESRLTKSKRSGFETYRQTTLTSALDATNSTFLERRVRGFLQRHMSGTTLENATVIQQP
ncbi:DUF3530 family protein [Marinibactrum halimedae]|uniref:DUF3530 family protein n=1 Tax=Marinibactrum halimedae TaxID=1444977 RepID=A0AA37T881_9GAMM|nr:DUF3530 family protein [Marinibactrum halimedae]MCD9459567.1 alpha/beta hydrolase family protein [Marinibactrum halimedae]GLS25616.1 hypothetical protein GCM10007877_13300 [Marinibactrum halimedae]